MRVTVCQLAEDRERFGRDWSELARHVTSEGSDLVVLPEMPFSPWLAAAPDFDADAWRAAVEDHEAWLDRLSELAPAAVVGSRPVEDGRLRLNEGFVWDPDEGYRVVHHKRYLPDEEGFYEARWFHPGNRFFETVEVAGSTVVGMQICSDLWMPHHLRTYVARGVHILTVPRATPRSSIDRWIVGGRATAIISGAFCLSSNRFGAAAGFGGGSGAFGGSGWVIDPDGDVLGTTTSQHRVVTVSIDVADADRAKKTYPRYLR